MNTKKWILIALTLLLTVSLAACNATKPERQKKTTEKGQMKVGEMMQEDKQHVWFVGQHSNTEDIDGTSNITRILVSKNGKMKVYDLQDTKNSNLNRYAKMSDKEIISFSEKQDKKRFDVVHDDLLNLTNGEIKEAKKYEKEGDDYESPVPIENESVVYGYASYSEDDVDVSLDKLNKYQDGLEKSKYKSPTAKPLKLFYKDSDLKLDISRNYPLPKNGVAHPNYVDEDLSALYFEKSLQPKDYNGQKFAGVAEDGDKYSEEKEVLFLTTKVNNKVKNVLIDENDDPAIKASTPKKGEE